MSTIYKEPEFEIYDSQGTWHLATDIKPEKPQVEVYADEQDRFFHVLDRIMGVLFWVAVIGFPLYLAIHVIVAVVRGVWP